MEPGKEEWDYTTTGRQFFRQEKKVRWKWAASMDNGELNQDGIIKRTSCPGGVEQVQRAESSIKKFF